MGGESVSQRYRKREFRGGQMGNLLTYLRDYLPDLPAAFYGKCCRSIVCVLKILHVLKLTLVLVTAHIL